MSDTRFTKGEWIADIRVGCCAVYPSSSRDEWEQGLCEDDRNLFYKSYPNVAMKPEFENLSIEHIANAHLIAAAPEMYAMLEEVVNRGVALLNSDEIEDTEDLASIHANFNDSVLKADRLLAKARGEQVHKL